MKFKPALLHFKFDNFASLPSEPDEGTYSEIKTDCNGHKWKLNLYPGGDSRNEEPGWISLFLYSKNNDHLDVRYIFKVNDANGATVKECEEDALFVDNTEGYGILKFMKRSDILEKENSALKNGTLCINLGIQVKDDKDHHFEPPSEHPNRMLNLLVSGEDADTFFNVSGKEFKCHSLIIKAHAPILANHRDNTISDITPEIFQLLLEYIYSGNHPEKDQILEHGKALIDAANKYELIELKMHVENVLVRERVMTKENVSDYILFADAQCCPLLKEYAMAFLSVHCREVLKSDHSKCLKDSGDLMSEIVMLAYPEDDASDAASMTVNELRKELGKRKLDVDGCRDTLVARLEDSKRQKTD